MAESSNTGAWKQVLFIAAGVACATPWSSPPLALAVGCVLALLGLTAFAHQSKAVSRQLIQWCVGTLRLLIPLPRLLVIAREGMIFAVATIVGTFVLGAVLGRLLRTGREQTILLSSGTAICGGSAIAAVGSAIGASSAGMAIATGAVFLLNAAGLYLFPPIGHWLHLSDAQFGTWAGVAIHDVSSVTGAASSYGGAATLDTATVVKLSRVLWIVPIALLAGWWVRRGQGTRKLPVPWLIVLFLLASLLATYVDVVAQYEKQIRLVARLGFQLALFLIGSGLSLGALRQVGWRALAQAVVMWIVLAVCSLLVVRATVR